MRDESLAQEIAEFSLSHPLITAIYRKMVRHRYLIFLSIIASISTYDLWFDSYEPLDPILFFGPAGLRLFSSDWLNTFSDPGVQLGPALVALFGLGALVNRATGLDIHVVVSPLVQVFVVFGTLWLVRTVRSGRGAAFPPGLQFFTGLAVLLGGIAWETSASGHAAEALGALLWVAAAFFAKHGGTYRPAVMIALAAILKPWGLLGLPILLLNPRLSRAAESGAVAVVVGVASYVPFWIWGEMKMFDIRWQVNPHSPLRVLLPMNARFDWNMRLIQGGVTFALGAALVLVSKRSRAAIWIVPLQVSLARLMFDPLEYHYYWMTPALIIMVGLLSEVPAEPSLRRIPIPLAFYALVWPFFYLRGIPLAILTVILVTAMLVGTIYWSRRTTDPPLAPA